MAVGLSVSVSFAIISVALFMGVASFIEAAESTLESLEKGVEKKVDRVVERARTKFQILNANINGTGISLNLTNTGSTTLTVSGVSIMLNGTCADDNVTNATVDGKVSNIWAPGEKLTVEISINATTGDRVKAITGNAVVQFGVVS